MSNQIDRALLRVVKYREQYDKVARYIPMSAIDKHTKLIVLCIGKYFKIDTEAEVIDFDAFNTLFFTQWNKKISSDERDFYSAVIKGIRQDASEEIRKALINQLLTLEYATDVGNAIAEYEQGAEIDLVPTLSKLADAIKDAQERTTKFDFAGFDDSTAGDGDDTGYDWPLRILNQHYRRIQGGDQYIIAARPGKGKTSWLTFMNAAMVKQMPDHKIIVWFNNESKKERIMSRQIMSALVMTNNELANMTSADRKEKYIAVMGSATRVRIYDVHGKDQLFLEDVLETIGLANVGAIIFDMLDNVKSHLPQGMREDQRLEQLYQWAREMGVKYDCPTFPTSQINKEGADLMFPLEHMLKESGTGKQGACDGILMIGSNAEYPMSRGLSMAKDKSKREGMQMMREEVIFDEHRGIFK